MHQVDASRGSESSGRGAPARDPPWATAYGDDDGRAHVMDDVGTACYMQPQVVHDAERSSLRVPRLSMLRPPQPTIAELILHRC